MKEKKLICITGLDGSGKSTLIDKLVEITPHSAQVHIWVLLEEANGLPFRSKKDIDCYLCGLTPDARLLFLAHALQYAMETALKSAAGTLFINAYYYKYFASELALGATATLATDLIKLFPHPDRTFFLDVPIPVAADRKARFSRYECGLSSSPDRSAFMDFQEKSLAQWPIFPRNHWITIDNTCKLEDNLAEISTQLR